MKYSVYAAQFKNSYVLVNQASANALVSNALGRKCFEAIGKSKSVIREKVIDGYRCDLYLPDSNTVLEVKTVLATGPSVEFPTIRSERRLQQLGKIEKLLDNGVGAYLVIVALNPYIREVTLSGSVCFQTALTRCISKGMELISVGVSISHGEFVIQRSVDLIK